jgi:hypothetical protein
MMKAGLPRPFAEAFAEMYGAFGSGKVTPKGDRMVSASTKVEDTLAELVR